MPLYKLSVEACNLETGRTASRMLEELAAPKALAVTLFETVQPRFVVEAYYEHEPSPDGIAGALVGRSRARATAASGGAGPELGGAVAGGAAPGGGRPVHRHGTTTAPASPMRRLGVEIEAGEAFGTGAQFHHRAVPAGRSMRSRGSRRFTRVLDLGCGSGVLGSPRHGCCPTPACLASDNDPLATGIAARQCAAQSRGITRARCSRTTGFDHPTLRRAQPVDLVLANILPGPLIDLAPAMRRAVRRGGVAVLSGLLNHQAREVAATYCAMGFHLLRRRQDAGWTALMLARR